MAEKNISKKWIFLIILVCILIIGVGIAIITKQFDFKNNNSNDKGNDVTNTNKSIVFYEYDSEFDFNYYMIDNKPTCYHNARGCAYDDINILKEKKIYHTYKCKQENCVVKEYYNDGKVALVKDENIIFVNYLSGTEIDTKLSDIEYVYFLNKINDNNYNLRLTKGKEYSSKYAIYNTEKQQLLSNFEFNEIITSDIINSCQYDCTGISDNYIIAWADNYVKVYDKNNLSLLKTYDGISKLLKVTINNTILWHGYNENNTLLVLDDKLNTIIESNNDYMSIAHFNKDNTISLKENSNKINVYNLNGKLINSFVYDDIKGDYDNLLIVLENQELKLKNYNNQTLAYITKMDNETIVKNISYAAGQFDDEILITINQNGQCYNYIINTNNYKISKEKSVCN